MPTNSNARGKRSQGSQVMKIPKSLLNNLKSTATILRSTRSDPPRIKGPGESWHQRKVSIILTQSSNVAVNFTLGALVSALSTSAANVPFRVKRICIWGPGACRISTTLNQSELLRAVDANAELTATDTATGTRIPHVAYQLPTTNLIEREVTLSNASVFATAFGESVSNATAAVIRFVCEVDLEFQF